MVYTYKKLDVSVNLDEFSHTEYALLTSTQIKKQNITRALEVHLCPFLLITHNKRNQIQLIKA